MILQIKFNKSIYIYRVYLRSKCFILMTFAFCTDDVISKRPNRIAIARVISLHYYLPIRIDVYDMTITTTYTMNYSLQVI